MLSCGTKVVDNFKMNHHVGLPRSGTETLTSPCRCKSLGRRATEIIRYKNPKLYDLFQFLALLVTMMVACAVAEGEGDDATTEQPTTAASDAVKSIAAEPSVDPAADTVISSKKEDMGGAER